MIIGLLIFALVLGALVFIHEFGHFSAAKLLGVRVEKFSLGLPPTAIKLFQKGDTEYVISWIPFGGYVKLAGEDPEKAEGADYELMAKPIWARFIIFFAGVFMNFLLGFLIFSMILWTHGTEVLPITKIGEVRPNTVASQMGFKEGDVIKSINGEEVNNWDTVVEKFYASPPNNLNLTVKRDNQTTELSYRITEEDSLQNKGVGFTVDVGTKIGNVQKDSPADEIGLKRGDVIVAINGKPVDKWLEMTEIIYGKANKPIHIEWLREGKRFESEVTPQEKLAPDEEQFGKTKKVGMIGVSVYYNLKRESFWGAVKNGFMTCINVIKLIFMVLGGLIGGKVSKDAIGGPVAVYQMTREGMQWGLVALLFRVAALSVNLAVLNILPIPALDGGHIFLLFVEAVKRQPLSKKTRLIWQQVGVAFLLLIMFFVISNEFIRLIFG